MHDRKLIVFSILLLIFLFTAPVFSQAPPQKTLPQHSEEEPLVQPEPPPQKTFVRLRDNLLAVELLNAEFGRVMDLISRKAGFKVEINPDVAARQLTTKFRDMELEDGITRLLTIVKEKNYLIRYDEKGVISKVEIYGTGSAPAAKPVTPAKPVYKKPSASSAPTGSKEPATTQKGASTFKRLLPPSKQREEDAKKQQQAVKDKDDSDSAEFEDNDEDIPYIPPPKNPFMLPEKAE
ncbi:MAG: hypothetical protein HZA17_12310 [Nitrospirae bacterium]|nr:hypothetical protein [Nitrospirota bacterium]